MNDSNLILYNYLNHRLLLHNTILEGNSSGQIILRELASSIIPSGSKIQWNRRPSISDDGTPVVLSLKTNNYGCEDKIRVLIESGSLRMSVSEQIAYSLQKLDYLLGLLEWRTASAQINHIIKQIFPAQANDTIHWRGGIWLGAEIKADLSESELRLYLNLRHGNADSRWRRLLCIISSFTTETIDPYLDEWWIMANSHAIPVGLGIVITNGYVKGIRAYVSVENPSLKSIEEVTTFLDGKAFDSLKYIHKSFISNFGEISSHGITIGIDFFTGAKQPSRVKVDLCCHLVKRKLEPMLIPWIKRFLSDYSFEPTIFQEFIDEVNVFWEGSSVQFLSLGYTSKLEHATIYIKPSVYAKSTV